MMIIVINVLNHSVVVVHHDGVVNDDGVVHYNCVVYDGDLTSFWALILAI